MSGQVKGPTSEGGTQSLKTEVAPFSLSGPKALGKEAVLPETLRAGGPIRRTSHITHPEAGREPGCHWPLSLGPLCSLTADAFSYQNSPGSPRPMESESSSLRGQKRRKENSYGMGVEANRKQPHTPFLWRFRGVPMSGTGSQATTPNCSKILKRVDNDFSRVLSCGFIDLFFLSEIILSNTW